MTDDELLDAFVASFARAEPLLASDVMTGFDDALLSGEELDGERLWRPLRVDTPASALEELVRRVGVPLPKLYGALALRYRWAEVEVDVRYCLLANLPGPGLAGLAARIRRDPAFVAQLLPVGYVPLGKAGATDYDPICFDTRAMHDDDCPVVRIDHEQVLCFDRVRVAETLAPSFRRLVESRLGR